MHKTRKRALLRDPSETPYKVDLALGGRFNLNERYDHRNGNCNLSNCKLTQLFNCTLDTCY